MNRDDFDAAASALIRRNYRHLDDLGGQPPAALLDGLWAMLEAHAGDILHEENGVTGQVRTKGGLPARLVHDTTSEHVPAMVRAGYSEPAPEPKPAPRRPARRTPK